MAVPAMAQKSGKKPFTVVIDAGHGGHDAGAVSSIAREKDLNLAVARKLRKLLQNKGFRVVMTRDSSTLPEEAKPHTAR